MCKVSRALCVTALLTILAVSGCESTPQPAQAVPDPVVPVPPATVDGILQSAERARDLAQKARFYLEALEQLDESGDVERLERTLRRIRAMDLEGGAQLADALSREQRYRFDAIGLDLAIINGEDREIERLLKELAPQGPAQERHAAALKARALSVIGDVAGALRLLIELADSTDEPAALRDLHAWIWRHLSRFPVLACRARAQSAPTASERAWWTLAGDFNAAVTSRGQARQWQRWRSRHPEHPAARHPPPGVSTVGPGPAQLALLVPVTGTFGAAGEAVRDGLLGAYLHAGEDTQRIQIYDTNAMSIRAAYELARRDGADVIIGPLQKEAVAAFAGLSPTLPVIALNHVDAGTEGARTFLQFSLAIEDQASAIAHALSAAGVDRIVLFDSPARWSVRARARFEDELEGIETVGFGTFHRVAEATNVVGDALHIRESQTRASELESLLGTTFEFAPRRRDDVDAVVALIDADELLSLKPALDYHFAGDLPLFAPATATLGSVDRSRLEGLRVCVMPWTLDTDALGKSVKDAFPTSRGAYASLFALGVDGFRLANQLDRLTVRREAIPGSTGVLSLGEDGRIQRTLVWAQVRDGRLVPLLDGTP